MKIFLILLLLSPASFANDLFSDVNFFDETPSAIYGMWPFKVLNNNWDSPQRVKQHFDQQRTLLRYLSSNPAKVKMDNSVTLAATGDILRIAEGNEYLTPQLKKYLSSFDVVTANLETLISNNFPTKTNNFFLVNSSATVISSTEVEQVNKSNIYTILSTANNHSFDYPDPARQDTLDSLKKHKVLHNGLIDDKSTPYTLFKKNGITFSYYAVSSFVNDTNLEESSLIKINPKLSNMYLTPWDKSEKPNLDDLERTIKAMRTNSDVVLISLHWGQEHESYPRPNQISVAHKLAAYGADIIIGNHSHAIQPSEVCFINAAEDELPAELASAQKQSGCVLQTADKRARKTLIHYSLGNFVGFTPFFWHQLGLINSVTFIKGENSHVDWLSPQSLITYDYVKEPPYGKHHTGLLTEYISSKECYRIKCPLGTQFLAKYAKRHIHGKSLSTREELQLAMVSFLHSFKGVILQLPKLLNGYSE